MLLTVTPSPCIERTVQIENFKTGAVHRVSPEDLLVNAGGKGINAARVAAQLGQQVVATGWIGNAQRDWFARQLAVEGVSHDFASTPADTRICVNALHDGHKTEIVEAGAPLSLEDGTQLLQKVDALLPRAKIMALCGSYPPAEKRLASTFNAHATILLQMAERHHVLALYDGKGQPFEMAVRAAPPWCIKPNLDEAAQLLHRPIHNEIDERRAIEQFLKWGVEVVLLSCGARGLWLGTNEKLTFFQAPSVREISPVGSGDSLVGAFLAKYLQNENLNEADRLNEAARWGVAAGAANAMQARSAFCTREEIEALLPQVQTREVRRALQVLS